MILQIDEKPIEGYEEEKTEGRTSCQGSDIKSPDFGTRERESLAKQDDLFEKTFVDDKENCQCGKCDDCKKTMEESTHDLQRSQLMQTAFTD